MMYVIRWSLGILLSIAALVTAVVAMDRLAVDGRAPDAALFAGRFHPLVVHLPIGILAAVALVEADALFRARWRTRRIPLLLLSLGAGAAIVATLCGQLLSWSGEYDARLLSVHRWLGTLTTALTLLLVLFCALERRARFFAIAYRVVLVATLAVLGIAGHYGATLTHGTGYLAHYWPFRADTPPVAQATAPLAESAPATHSLFAAHVQPVFSEFCIQCHGPDKSKGGLRLDSFESVMHSGEDGPVVVPGDGAGSHMVERLLLPVDHEDHMPPEGKRQPSKDAIALVKWWIDEGASPDAPLDPSAVPPQIARILGVDPPVLETPAEPVQVALLSWQEVQPILSGMPVAGRLEVLPISQTEPGLRVRCMAPVGDGDIAALAPIQDQVLWLDLSGSSITDEALKTVGSMRNLQRLYLQNTAITDAGLNPLAGLPKLEYLNLHGTAITDTAVECLGRIPSLRQVYLWNTGVTAEGIARLHDALYDDTLAESWRQEAAQLLDRADALEVRIEAGMAAPAAPAEPATNAPAESATVAAAAPAPQQAEGVARAGASR